jgi:hypothetical protein
MIRSLRIQTYKAQLAVCNHVRAVLLKELENVNLIDDQRVAIGRRSNDALKESRALKFMLDLTERHDREARICPV